MPFQPAVRSAVKLKIGVQGPSGSGKTLGALVLARHIVGPKGKIAVIDTENKTASLYSDRISFDTLSLEPPYTSQRYINAIREAVEAGYDILVVDSISHQWNGEGGILARKEEMDKRPGSNSFTNWATFTPEQEKFKAALSNADIHLIATMRSKQDYVLGEKNGRQVPQKVGLAAVQREGMEYELSLVFEVDMNHRAIVSKDRTGVFGEVGATFDLTEKPTAKMLMDWHKSGKPLPTREEIAAAAEAELRIAAAAEAEERERAQAAAEERLRTETRLPGTKDHFDGCGGKLVNEVPDEVLLPALQHLRKLDAKREEDGHSRKYDDVCEAIGLVMLKRKDDEAAELAAASNT